MSHHKGRKCYEKYSNIEILPPTLSSVQPTKRCWVPAGLSFLVKRYIWECRRRVIWRRWNAHRHRQGPSGIFRKKIQVLRWYHAACRLELEDIQEVVVPNERIEGYFLGCLTSVGSKHPTECKVAGCRHIRKCWRGVLRAELAELTRPYAVVLAYQEAWHDSRAIEVYVSYEYLPFPHSTIWIWKPHHGDEFERNLCLENMPRIRGLS